MFPTLSFSKLKFYCLFFQPNQNMLFKRCIAVCVCVCVCVCVLSCFSPVWLFVILWTVAQQALLSMGFSRQKSWSGLPCPPPGDFPDPGIKPISLVSPALAGGFFTTSTTWNYSRTIQTKPQRMMPSRCCCRYVSKSGRLSSGHRTAKGQSSSQFPRRVVLKNFLTIGQLHPSSMLVRSCLKSCMIGFSIMWTKKFQMNKLGLEKEEEPEIKLPTFAGS